LEEKAAEEAWRSYRWKVHTILTSWWSIERGWGEYYRKQRQKPKRKINKKMKVIFNDADSSTYFMYFRMGSDIFDTEWVTSRFSRDVHVVIITLCVLRRIDARVKFKMPKPLI
jgi:hypothetical protein